MGRGNSKRRGGRGRGSSGSRGSRGGSRGSGHRGRGGSRGRGQKRRGGFDSDSRRPNKFRRRDEEEDEETTPTVQREPDPSSESSEEEDPYKELLGTMDLKKRTAVVSSEEEEDSSAEDAEGSDEEKERQPQAEAGRDSESGKEEEEVEDEESEPDEQEDETEGISAAEEKECASTMDPFSIHLHGELSSSLLSGISADNPIMESKKLFWPNLGHIQLQMPKVEAEKELEKPKFPMPLLEDEKVFLKPGADPDLPSSSTEQDWSKLFVKQQIQSHLSFANTTSCSTGGMTGLQSEVFAILNNYQDFYMPERSSQNAEELRFVYCLHAVNHVLKTRSKILMHNSRLVNRTEVPDEFRDQGLVRPKVLILLPFRDSALRTINMIISILLGNEKGTVMNQKRYIEEFTGDQLALPKKNPKPEDYENLFRGNTDDNFRIGMSFTKKRLKLYSDFYQSDIIVASPLGLRMIVGAEGDEKRDFDFLAGLELVIVDQAEVCYEQNWDHLLHIWDHFHLQPKEAHSTDFSRLRFSALAGHSKYLSQTCILSGIQLPELAAVFRKRCRNFAGKVVVSNPIKVGSISQVVVHLPQVFQKIEANSAAQCIERRFEVFTTKILPQFKDSLMSHTLIFVPSYFDYVRLRNYFQKEEIGFVQICEYTKEGKIARARDLFFHNEGHFMLYSERFHFFRRIRLKGIRHLIFYQPPTFPNFYPELCNFMQDSHQNRKKEGGSSSNMTVTVLYSKYDIHRIAAIIGSERASKMISSEKSIHMMVTGGD